MKIVRTLMLLLPMMAMTATSALATTPLSQAEYRQTLQRLDVALRRDDLVMAKQIALSLRGRSWNAEGDSVDVDGSLLEPVIAARDAAAARPARSRLEATLQQSERLNDHSAQPVDLAMLDRLARDEKAPSLVAGGEVKQLPPANESFWTDMARRAGAFWKWLTAQVEKIYDWLRGFWPHEGKAPQQEAFGLPFGVAALVLCILLVLLALALETWRRGAKRQRATPLAGVAAATRGDDDPLSRDVNEWERYAHELGASGRIREAIRAWYHAVLVAAYRSGLLRYRKGRTNWEYVRSLDATLDWRPRFSAMTRLFEREWYGREQSTPEVLDVCSSEARTILDAIARGASS